MIDPFNFKDIIGYRASRVLYELIYCSTTSFDFCLLIVWVGLYNAFKTNKNNKFSYCYYAGIKFICIFLMIIAYPLQICFSFYNSSRATSTKHLNFILYIMIILNGIVVIFTFVYTIHLRIRLRKGYMNTEKEKTLEVKVVNNKDIMTSNTNAMIYTNTSQIGNTSIRQPNTNEPISIAKVAEVKYFLKEIFQKNLIKTVDKYVLEHNVNSNNSDTFSIDYQKEMSYLDDPITQISINDISMRRNSHDEHLNTVNIESNRCDETFPIKHQASGTSSSKAKNDEQKNNSIMELTEGDLKHLNNIFSLSYYIILSQIIVFIIVILTNFEHITKRPGVVISMIVVEFIFELSGFYALIRLFVQDIKSQEYMNLRIIAEIEKYTSQQNKDDENGEGNILKFDFIKQQQVWKRFKSFLTLYGNNS